MEQYKKNRPWKKLYSTKRWKLLRLHHLTTHPICVMCDKQRKITPACIVDHIIPHKGDERLFFDINNLQSLCKLHHDSSKQKAEKNNVDEIGCDENGFPTDKNSHWWE